MEQSEESGAKRSERSEGSEKVHNRRAPIARKILGLKGRRSLRPTPLSPVDLSFLARGCRLNTLSILNQLLCRRSIVGRTPRFIRERLSVLTGSLREEHDPKQKRWTARNARGCCKPKCNNNCTRRSSPALKLLQNGTVGGYGACYSGIPATAGGCKSIVSFTALACTTSESRRGSGCFRSGKSGCSLCFADASERGVVLRLRWRRGSACFALALRSLCARSPGCGCFC